MSNLDDLTTVQMEQARCIGLIRSVIARHSGESAEYQLSCIREVLDQHDARCDLILGIGGDQ